MDKEYYLCKMKDGSYKIIIFQDGAYYDEAGNRFENIKSCEAVLFSKDLEDFISQIPEILHNLTEKITMWQESVLAMMQTAIDQFNRFKEE